MWLLLTIRFCNVFIFSLFTEFSNLCSSSWSWTEVIIREGEPNLCCFIVSDIISCLGYILTTHGRWMILAATAVYLFIAWRCFIVNSILKFKIFVGFTEWYHLNIFLNLIIVILGYAKSFSCCILCWTFRILFRLGIITHFFFVHNFKILLHRLIIFSAIKLMCAKNWNLINFIIGIRNSISSVMLLNTRDIRNSFISNAAVNTVAIKITMGRCCLLTLYNWWRRCRNAWIVGINRFKIHLFSYIW